jgi:hypothetical protein
VKGDLWRGTSIGLENPRDEPGDRDEGGNAGVGPLTAARRASVTNQYLITRVKYKLPRQAGRGAGKQKQDDRIAPV